MRDVRIGQCYKYIGRSDVRHNTKPFIIKVTKCIPGNGDDVEGIVVSSEHSYYKVGTLGYWSVCIIEEAWVLVANSAYTYAIDELSSMLGADK